MTFLWACERLQVLLPAPGHYLLSASGAKFSGDISLDWRIENEN